MVGWVHHGGAVHGEALVCGEVRVGTSARMILSSDPLSPKHVTHALDSVAVGVRDRNRIGSTNDSLLAGGCPKRVKSWFEVAHHTPGECLPHDGLLACVTCRCPALHCPADAVRVHHSLSVC